MSAKVCPKCGHRMIESQFRPPGHFECPACDHAIVTEEQPLELDIPLQKPMRKDQDKLLTMLAGANIPYMVSRAVHEEEHNIITVENRQFGGKLVDVVFKFWPSTGKLYSVSVRKG